jgi:hypothetical protein
MPLVTLLVAVSRETGIPGIRLFTVFRPKTTNAQQAGSLLATSPLWEWLYHLVIAGHWPAIFS